MSFRRKSDGASWINSLEEWKLITNSNSAHFGRENPLNGAYISHCLEAISSSREHPTDPALVLLMRMTEISDHISSPNLSERNIEPYASLVEGANHTIRSDLARLREEVTSTVDLCRSQRINFECSYNYLVARMNEPATHLGDILASGGTASAHRALRLRSCLDAVIAYFETRLNGSVDEMLDQSLVFRQQASFVLVVATRLAVSTAGAKDWDIERVRERLDLKVLLEKLILRMESAEAESKSRIVGFAERFGWAIQPGELEEKGVWGTMAQKMANVGTWFERVSNGQEAQDERKGEVDELLLRMRGTLGGEQGWGREDEGPTWVGLLPMGTLGWRYDDV